MVGVGQQHLGASLLESGKVLIFHRSLSPYRHKNRRLNLPMQSSQSFKDACSCSGPIGLCLNFKTKSTHNEPTVTQILFQCSWVLCESHHVGQRSKSV